MNNSDFDAFVKMWRRTCECYPQSQRPGDGALEFMFEALQDFNLRDIGNALIRHVQNPDSGQFAPKPADIVRLLGGTTTDAGTRAWNKVLHAIKTVGPYRSPVFDDPIVHRCIQELGGWIELNHITDDDVPHVGRRFAGLYSGFASRGLDRHPHGLTGIADAHNEAKGFGADEPVVLGDERRAAEVVRSGSQEPLVKITHASTIVAEALRRKKMGCKTGAANAKNPKPIALSGPQRRIDVAEAGQAEESAV